MSADKAGTVLGGAPAAVARLTDEMIADISAYDGFDTLAELVAHARSGGGAAYRRLSELSVRISTNAFGSTWCGRLSVDEVRTAFTHELNVLRRPAQEQSAVHASRSPARTVGDFAESERGPTPTAPFRLPPWRDIAGRAKFPIQPLAPTEKELLEVIDRVLVRAEGWGPKDSMRGRRKTICLRPVRLEKSGARKSARSYQRAIARLLDLQLLRVVATNGDGTREFVPTWWSTGTLEGAIEIWRRAAALADSPPAMSDLCRTNVGPLSHPPFGRRITQPFSSASG